MVTEVTERALAHTEKREVLLTGGVAANKRLQSMLMVIAEEHDAEFKVVPREFAADNGAMIAWTGVLAYTHGLVTPVEESFVRLEVARGQGGGSMAQVAERVLLKKGAEASLFLADWHGRRVVVKARLPKLYRPAQLDSAIRRYRTVHEPQLMH